jgi:hypothetical protein
LISQRRNKDDEVQEGDVRRAVTLFFDTKRSQDALRGKNQVYITSESFAKTGEEQFQEEEDEEQ